MRSRAKRGGVSSAHRAANRRFVLTLLAGVVLVLPACTAQQQVQLTAAGDKIAELCARALPLATLAAPLPVVGPYIAAGVTVGCTTADGLSRLRADAGSVAWLAEQIGLLRAALHQ